jgi:hypothetical protein
MHSRTPPSARGVEVGPTIGGLKTAEGRARRSLLRRKISPAPGAGLFLSVFRSGGYTALQWRLSRRAQPRRISVASAACTRKEAACASL